jgi:hypothetical protein
MNCKKKKEKGTNEKGPGISAQRCFRNNRVLASYTRQRVCCAFKEAKKFMDK